MGKALLVLMLVATLGWGEGPDPIDQLAKNLTATHGLWKNGVTPDLGLPEGARTPELLKRIFANGPVTSYTVMRERAVQIDQDTYRALLLDTNVGRQVVFLRWEGGRWWSRAMVLPE